MISISSTPSCGLYYLGGETLYKTAEVYFKDLAMKCFGKDGKTEAYMVNTRNINQFCLFVWTHPPQKYSIGDLMKKYIEKYDLGVVVESPKGKNPLHKEHDGAVVWTWVRHNDNFRKHCMELLCKSPEPVTAGLTTLKVSGSLVEIDAVSLSAPSRITAPPLATPTINSGICPA